ncbi:MAG: diguanylate cyclase [Anaerovoracaceae bacterium]|jgi:diguanylate cyclase (GGDEF)-like protein/putative nucleotidyltransferase with HDIG domain|nr:diguanylate cyclase [Anaerovoracaceae bacterium]
MYGLTEEVRTLINSFVYIPIAALVCYGFLLLAFMAAKKTKVIQAFIFVLISGVLWTGGSFFMRMGYAPSLKFWFDVSLWGLLLITYSFMLFVRDFVGSKPIMLDKVWGLLVLLAGFVNTFTGVLVTMPTAVIDEIGNVGYIYDIKWPVIFLFILCGGMVIEMFWLIVRCFRYDVARKKQFSAVSVGIISIFIGHALLLLPAFRGIPIDIASGLVMVLCLFYALYRRRLFKLTLLVSKASSYAIVALLSIFIFSNLIIPIDKFLARFVVFETQQKVMLIAVAFALFSLAVYYIVKKFIDGVFIRDEIIRAEHLKDFSVSVSKTLKISEIMEELVAIIENTLLVRNAYVCISSPNGKSFSMVHAENPLDNFQLTLSSDNPIIRQLKKSRECLFMEDLRRFPDYRSMWEGEKRILQDLGIECFVPLSEEDNLVGVVLLTAKERNARFSYDDISFLESVNAIGSIAIKNSSLYEKAFMEARTDDLTKLLNRKCFYETLEAEYQNNRENSLALVIFNLDDFKLYNQLYGNKEGDLALKRVADILKASVNSDGLVARQGGKEFAAILPGHDMLSAKNLAQSIRNKILDLNKSSPDYSMKILTVSIGISAIPYTATSIKELVDNAELAVYKVKRSGKNSIALSASGLEGNGESGDNEEPNRQEIYSEYASTIYALAAAIDAKDHYTFDHSKNVAYYSTELAYGVGLGEDTVEIIREAALLHDIGKIGIAESVLNKPGPLTKEEYGIMQGHVESSVSIIRHLPSLDYVIPAVIGHHEWYNGKGYPRRIAGDDIPLSARILCIADCFDAMISLRPYKAPNTVDYAMKELINMSGRQFDPKLVTVFIGLLESGKMIPRIREKAELKADYIEAQIEGQEKPLT